MFTEIETQPIVLRLYFQIRKQTLTHIFPIAPKDRYALLFCPCGGTCIHVHHNHAHTHCHIRFICSSRDDRPPSEFM